MSRRSYYVTCRECGRRLLEHFACAHDHAAGRGWTCSTCCTCDDDRGPLTEAVDHDGYLYERTGL